MDVTKKDIRDMVLQANPNAVINDIFIK